MFICRGPPGFTDNDVQLITDDIKKICVIYNHILVVRMHIEIKFGIKLKTGEWRTICSLELTN